jgi:predicted Fe-Mo cluster-binding NifX family protein
MPDELITIAQFADSCEANLAKQLLADFGIEAVVTGENFANLYPALPLQLVKLQVRESQSRQVREILESHDTQESKQDDMKEDIQED